MPEAPAGEPAQRRPTFIFFDVAYTLLRVVPSVGYHYARVAADHGFAADGDALNDAFIPAWRAAKRTAAIRPGLPYGTTRAEALTFWCAVIEACFRESGQQPPPPQSPFYEAVFDAFEQPSCWALYHDVEPALALLEQAGMPFGILSNFDPRLRPILKNLGLAGRFQHIVLSADAGEEKPSPAIFRHAELQLLPPQRRRIALIGDDEKDDGAGARAARWQSALVLRNGQPPQDASLPWASTLNGAVASLLS